MFGIAKQFVALPTLDHLLIGGVLFFQMALAPRFGMWIYSLFSLPGTAAHEFCHWLVGLVLGARPSFPNIVPERSGNAWRLGSVRSSPNILTLIPIAIAPIVLLPIGIWYATVVLVSATGWWWLFHGWITSTMLAASLPSRQDWSIAMPAIIGAMLLLFVLQEVSAFRLEISSSIEDGLFTRFVDEARLQCN